MTKEEITGFLATEEGKAVLSEIGLVDSNTVNAMIEEKTKGLLNKRDELLKTHVEDKEYKHKFNEIKNMLDSNGLKDYNELGDLLDRIKNPNEPEDQRHIRNDLIKTKAEYEKYKNDYQTLSEDSVNDKELIKRLLVNSEIKTSLLAEGCNKEQAEAISNYILMNNKFDVVTENNDRKAITENGLVPSEFMTQWKATEEAKNLLPVKQSTGSNALGSSQHTKTVNVGANISNAAKQGDTLAGINLIDQQYQN